MNEDLLETNKLHELNNLSENLLEDSIKETEKIYKNNKTQKKLKKTIITVDSKNRNIKNIIATEKKIKLKNNPLTIKNKNEIIVFHENHNYTNTTELLFKNIRGDIIDNNISDKLCNIPLNLLNYNENNGGPIFSIQIIPKIINNQIITDNNGNFKSDEYIIKIENKGLKNILLKSDVGGSDIIVENVIDFIQGYSNACSYKISLGRKFINIREIKLLSIEMPNSQYAIRNKKKDNLTDIINKEDFNISNDTLYWINEDEKVKIKEQFNLSDKKLMQLNNNLISNLNYQKDIKKSEIKKKSLYNVLEYKYNNIVIKNLLQKGNDLIIFLNNLKKEIKKKNLFFKENNTEEIDFSLNYLLNFNININGGLLIDYEIDISSDIIYNVFDNYIINYNKTHNKIFNLITNDLNIDKQGKVRILMNEDYSLNKIIVVETGANYIENEIVKINLEDNSEPSIITTLLIRLNKNCIKKNIKFYLENPLENKIFPQLTIDNIYFKIENYDIKNFNYSSNIISDSEKRKEYEEYIFKSSNIGLGNIFDENNNTSIVRSNNDESIQETTNKFLIGYKFNKPILINRYTLKVPDLTMNFLQGTSTINKNDLGRIIGLNTLFTNELIVNDIIKINNISRRVIKIISNVELETELWDQEYNNMKIKKISHKYPKNWSFEGSNDIIINENNGDKIIYNKEENTTWEKIQHIVDSNSQINYINNGTDIELNYNWNPEKITVFNLNNNKKYKNYRLVIVSNFDGHLNSDINKNIYISELRMYSYIENINIFHTDLLYNKTDLCNFIDFYNRYLNENKLNDNNLLNLLFNELDNNLLLNKLDKNLKDIKNTIELLPITSVEERDIKINKLKELIGNNYLNIISTRLTDKSAIINNSINDIMYNEIKINYKYISNIISKILKELLKKYNNYSFNGSNNSIEIFNKITNIEDQYYWTIDNRDINKDKSKIYVENKKTISSDTLIEGLEDEYIEYISDNNTNIYNIYPIHNIVIQQGNYSSSKFIKEVESKMNNVGKLRYNFNRKSYEEMVEYDDRLTCETKPVYHNFEIELNSIKQSIKINQTKKIFQYSNINKDISGEGGPIYCNENYPYLYIKHRNHNLKTGDIIDISGASGVYNISANQINISHSIYVHETYRCYIRLMYPIIKGLNEQLLNLDDSNINIYKKFYEDYVIYNNNENNLIEYTDYKSSNSLAEIGYYEIVDKGDQPLNNYDIDTDIFLKNELIIKINNVNVSKKYNNTLGRISHINKRNSNTGNYLLDYMLLSESNFKIGDIIKTSVSNCFGIIVPENWSHNRLPTLSELGTNINLNQIINGYDGYSIQLSTSPNRTTLTGLGGINMSINIPLKTSLLFNLSNTPYKELGFENKKLEFDYQHSNTIISSSYKIDYIYVENDFSDDTLNDKHIIIKTQNENNFNIGDKIYIKDFKLYTNLFKTTPNTLLEIDSYEPFINWFDNQNINYQKILKKNIDFNELQQLLNKSIIIYFNHKYSKEQNEYLGNIGMNIEQYKNINHLDFKKNPLINIFSIKKNSYVYIYYNKRKTNITTSDGENILSGLSDGYYKVLGNLPAKNSGFINNYDNINSVIIDISSSDTYPDSYNIKNFTTHIFKFDETTVTTTENYKNPDISVEPNNELYLNEYYLNNTEKPNSILDGKLNRGILRTSLNKINICGNNKELEFSHYTLNLSNVLSNNKIEIKHNELTNIPVIYKNYYKINKLILIGGKYLNNTDYKKYNNYSDYINDNNIQLNIIKEIIYYENYYEIKLQFNLENFSFESDNKNDYIDGIENIFPFYDINFVYKNSYKNQNKISIYKKNFKIDDLLNKCISVNDFIDTNILTEENYINQISNINNNNINYHNLLNVKSNSDNNYNIVIDLESFLIENFTEVYKIGNFYITELNDNNNIDKNIITNTIKYISNFIDLNKNGYITNNILLNNLVSYVVIISDTNETNLTDYSNIITNTYNKIPYLILTDDIIKFNNKITNNDLINYNISYIVLICSTDKDNNKFYIDKSYPINNNDIVIFKNNTKFTNEIIINKKFIIKNYSNNSFELYFNDDQSKILQIQENYSQVEITTDIYKNVKSSWRPTNFDYLIEYIFDLIIKSISLNNNAIWNLEIDSIIGHYLTDDINNNKFNISIQQEQEIYLWDMQILDYILHVWLLTLANKPLSENQKQIKIIMNKSLFQFNFDINYSYILYSKLTKYTLYSEINVTNHIVTYNSGSTVVIYDLFDNLLVNYIVLTEIDDINYYDNNIGSFILFGKNSNYDYNDNNNWELIKGYNLNSPNSSDGYSYNINYTDNKAIFEFSNNTNMYRYYKFIFKSRGLLNYKFSNLYLKHIQFNYLYNDTISTYAIQKIYTNFNSTFKYVPFSILDNITQNENISLIFNSESGIITFDLENESIVTYFKIIIFQEEFNFTNQSYNIKSIDLYGTNNPSNENNYNLIHSYFLSSDEIINEISQTFTNTNKYKYYKFKIISNFIPDNNNYLNPILVNNVDKIIISSLIVGDVKKYDYNKLYIQDNNYIINVVDKDTYYELELKYNLINSHLAGENIIIMDNKLENNMFNTQNLLMNGKWYTRIFYQGNKSIYDFSADTNTLYENSYKILSTNITNNKIIKYKLTVNSTADGNKYYLNNIKQKTLSFNPGDIIQIDITNIGANNSLHPFKFATTDNGRHNQYYTLTNETIVKVVSYNGNKYTFNNNDIYYSKYNISLGQYIFKNIPLEYPLAILSSSEFITYIGDNDKKFSKNIQGTTYDFYYGDITVNVLKEFDEISIYSYNDGYLGGQNIFKFSNKINYVNEYTNGVTENGNIITLSTDSSTPANLYYYCNNHSFMGGKINNLGNNVMSQIYYDNGSIYNINNIFINEHNNVLFMGYTNSEGVIIDRKITIPSKLNEDNNGITFYTPEEFVKILQDEIYKSYLSYENSIICDIEITYNKKNQIFQFYSPSNTVFNLYFNNNFNNNYIYDNILRTIGFNNSQINNYLYYTNTNFILYRNSKVLIDVSNINLENNNIFIYEYINNNYINCSDNKLFYKYGISKRLDNKIAIFYLNNDGLVNYENDYDYNLIWSLGTIDKKNINNNNYTGNIIIKHSHKKEQYPYFQEYLPNEIYISDMKGFYIPNTNIYTDTDDIIKIKQNNVKTYIYPLQEKHYTTAEYTNLEYVFNHEKKIFNIDPTFEENFSPENYKTDKLYINNGLPILGYFKNNYYVNYQNNKWCILYLGSDTIIKEFNSKLDAFHYLETLDDEWINSNSQEKFYVNYYSILIEGKYRGLGGNISNRWKPESNVLNDFYFGFTIKDKIIDVNYQYTKLKTIVKLRDLGVNAPKQIVGDIEYLNNNIKDYILGYDGTIFEKELNNPVDISGEKYIYLSVKGFNKILDINKSISAFAKIILPSAPGKNMYNNFISTETTFEDKPLDELTELDIDFFDSLGNLFDFNRLNHSFTLEITEEIDYIEDTNILSKTLFQL